MEEDDQNPYYPITDRQRYPSFPPEDTDVHACSGQNIDLQFQRHQLQNQYDQLQMQHEQLQSQYNQLQMQHNNLQTTHNELQSKHNRLRSHVCNDPIALQRITLALNLVHGASLVKHDEHEAPAANLAPVGGHRYITRRTKKTETVVKGERKMEPDVKEEPRVATVIKEERNVVPFVKEEPIEDDRSHLTPDREYAPSSASLSDEEMEDEDYEPTPAPVAPIVRSVASPATIARPFARPTTVAPPATVAPHELRFTMKADREANMSIYHRKEFAYCEIAMTKEEYYHVKGQNYVAPQTLATPDRNGNTEDRRRLRITWAERDRLNAWRARHGRKPHEIREGTKYAAARDFWRLNPPLAIEPRRTVEWKKEGGDIPAP
ncbi:uncharacterized protein Bfra_012028 [Botrytis fragariae]|uniref:Uncharacterized protein n=1 Tax=Botrytis fragariae TaxID=1964551 RepID=A0A8H6EE21_9HELO|nr:uncharacterized protein Bfra_012028 [Botrytis fragariae]KAF5868698.1 hypothetical protein Bfra_012028 [Botrytis fragariae]